MFRKALQTLVLLPALYFAQANAQDTHIPEPFQRERPAIAEIVNLESYDGGKETPIKNTPPRRAEFLKPTLENTIQPDLAKIETWGDPEKSRVFLVPIMHPKSTEFGVFENESILKIAVACQNIAKRLHDSGLADKMVLEGITPGLAERYNERKKIFMKSPNGAYSPSLIVLSMMLNERPWELAGLETEEHKDDKYPDLLATKYELMTKVAAKSWEKRGFLDSKETFEKNKKRIKKELGKITDEYMHKVEHYFKDIDPQGKKGAHLLTTYREEGMAKKLFGGGLNFFGAIHEQGIRRELERKGIPYSVLRIPEVPIMSNIPKEEVERIARINMVTLERPITLKLKDGSKEKLDTEVAIHPTYEGCVSPGTEYWKNNKN